MLNCRTRCCTLVLFVAAASGLLLSPLADPLAAKAIGGPLPNVVTFRFTSPQFDFESGTVLLFRVTYGVDAALSSISGQRLSLDELARGGHSPQAFSLQNGFVRDVTVDLPGRFQALLSGLTVVRRWDQRRFEIRGLQVSSALTEDALRQGVVEVSLDIPVVLILRVEDSAGQGVSGAALSVLTATASFDVRCNERGEVTLLGTVGTYRALVSSVGGRQFESQPSTFEVTPLDSGERLLILNVK